MIIYYFIDYILFIIYHFIYCLSYDMYVLSADDNKM